MCINSKYLSSMFPEIIHNRNSKSFQSSFKNLKFKHMTRINANMHKILALNANTFNWNCYWLIDAFPIKICLISSAQVCFPHSQLRSNKQIAKTNHLLCSLYWFEKLHLCKVFQLICHAHFTAFNHWIH